MEKETLIISTSNQGSSTLQLSPLGEGISAEVIDNNTVKVKAEANTSTNEIKKRFSNIIEWWKFCNGTYKSSSNWWK